jgi:hypothetical protein
MNAAINIALRAQIKLKEQEPPAYLAQAESKRTQAMRAEGRPGRRELDPTQPRPCSLS